MNKFSFIILSLHGTMFAFSFFPGAHGQAAQPLLTFNSAEKTYELNRSFLQDVAKLPLPIRVIAIHGDEKVDKLIISKLIKHVWNGANHTFVEQEEVCQTGDGLVPVTRGVWAYITQNKEGSIILLDVEADDLVDETLKAHLHMFTGMISSGLNIMVREYVQNSDLHSLYYLTRLNELIFPNSSSGNFPKLQVTVSGAVKDPSGRSVEDHTRDFIAGHSLKKVMAEERKIIAKYFPRDEIAVSEIPHVEDGLFKDFEKLSGSEYLKAMVTLAIQLTEFPIKRTPEGRPMDGVALSKLIERLAETISAEGWMNFANTYDTIEINICKRSEAKFLTPLFKLGSGQIEFDEKTLLDAFKKNCRLESGIKSAREKLQQIIQAKKTLEDLEIALAQIESKKMEEVGKRAKTEEEIQKIIEGKDKEIAKETKARKEAERRVQDLLEKLNTCESLLKAQIEKGWMYALRSALSDEDVAAGSKLLYSQAREKKEEDDTNCNKMLQDEIKKLKENQKRIIDALETKYSLQALSEALIKVLSLCSSVMGLALQIRALRR